LCGARLQGVVKETDMAEILRDLERETHDSEPIP
jgi:hypothetical protein